MEEKEVKEQLGFARESMGFAPGIVIATKPCGPIRLCPECVEMQMKSALHHVQPRRGYLIH